MLRETVPGERGEATANRFNLMKLLCRSANFPVRPGA